jgi:excisionase family DNA binding protein
MSSNLELKRVCQHCGKSFIAKKTSTKFCSLQCGQRNYKIRERINTITASNSSAKASLGNSNNNSQMVLPTIEQEFLNVKMLALTTNVSERTIFRLIKDQDFPKMKIGRRLLFHKHTVVKYLMDKYGNI